MLGAGIWATGLPSPQLLASCVGGGGYGPTATCGPYAPLTPTRVLDTRHGLGFTGPVAANTSFSLTLAGRYGVPAVGGASAVVLNVTGTNATQGTFITVYPAGAIRPVASNLNIAAGATVANLVEVRLSASGSVDFYSSGSGTPATGTVQLVADLEGYVSTSATGNAGLFNPVTPARVLDTVTGTGGVTGPVAAGSTINFPATSIAGVPLQADVSAVVFNLTATQATVGSYVTAFPDGGTKPTASNLNVDAGATIANRVIVPVVDGDVSLFVCGFGASCSDGGSIQLIADINGYFTSAAAPSSSGSDYNAESPQRICDTRPGNPSGLSGAEAQCNDTPLAAGATRTITVAGVDGVPLMSASSPPTAVVLNVTVVLPSAGTYVTVWPANLSEPGTSDINCPNGQIQPNLVVVGLSPTGTVSFFNDLGTTNIVVDVEGWYS